MNELPPSLYLSEVTKPEYQTRLSSEKSHCVGELLSSPDSSEPRLANAQHVP